MKAKFRLKKTGDNEYTRATGVRAYSLKGGSKCVVSAVDSVYYNTYKVQPHAYYIFNIESLGIAFNPKIKVTSTCRATNCVNRSHLVGTYKPAQKDIDYLKDYLSIDGLDYAAHTLQVPKKLLIESLELIHHFI